MSAGYRYGARLLSALAVVVSRHTALRALLRLPMPERRYRRRRSSPRRGPDAASLTYETGLDRNDAVVPAV
ncbi:hypothetical protein KBX06_18700 [Micromonospora sp. C31]|uniref:hypothetical protein n=1 Tax=Micromonospora sp. C31 TaxID=2824876 RepID=UPI001B35D1E0|nr:hypothetical protein [Micromonospora sp. C31]MBQ1075179.1 hypothetical protein [Micromonospora sp. C31]